ncbi:hypothetical protein GCM10010387_67210 [Streptomyces inusitatus]|uniref:Uncharacterized protein n=1 Tax=Streptomyces inusitatus TaxID=68221 RepID=A0A918QSS3_9ACTN|nr:hypothetical protein [Streptomyces inusitatus]GGZ64614.1 hypothetical protein GCM10010387_67210 [Streptomyces inusitatus]
MDDRVGPEEGRNTDRKKQLRMAVAVGVGSGLSVALVVAGLAFAFNAADSSDGKGTSAAGSPSPSDKEADEKYVANLAFSKCLRAQGVDKFPLPESNGSIRLEASSGIDVNTKEFKKAEETCRKQAPPVGQKQSRPPDAPKIDASKYVACMRENGQPDFPEPDEGGMFMGIDLDTPEYKAAQKACVKLMPVLGGPPAANS